MNAPVEKNIKQPRVSVVILIDGRIPIFKRSKNGQWWYDLPGGKPDPIGEKGLYEDYEQAAIREIEEELGIEADFIKKLDVMAHPHNDAKSMEIIFVACNHKKGEPHNAQPDHHDAMELLEWYDAVEKLKNSHLTNRSSINDRMEIYIRQMCENNNLQRNPDLSCE